MNYFKFKIIYDPKKNCHICYSPFDHSINKPFQLNCPHTFFSSCLKKIDENRCPSCKQIFYVKHSNNALLELIPESSYDKIKNKSLITLISLSKKKSNANTT